ncbi:MAG: SGNH/GDSL hydrolase family protein [Polyangiales bacterium]
MRARPCLRSDFSWSTLVIAGLSLGVGCSQDSGADPAPASDTAPAAVGGNGSIAGAAGSTAAQSGGVAGIARGGSAASSGAPAGGSAAPQAGTGTGNGTGPVGGAASGSAAASGGAAASEPATAGTSGVDAAAPAGGAGGTGGSDGVASAGSAAAGSGAGGAPGAGTGAVDPATPDWSLREDLGKGDGSDVITIGDSWMDYIGGGGGIEAGLDRAGTNYRHYGLSATTLLSGQIPRQYTRAKGENPSISTVIMTGGGNDIMFSGGCNTAEACEQSVAMIQAALDELWTEMAADGVKDVIYIQYSADAGTAPTGTRPKETKPVPICLTGQITCHSLPTTDLVMGALVDGIHPSASANDRIAAALLELMETRKMRR